MIQARILFLCILMLTISGCSRSFDVSYVPNTYPNTHADSNIKIGIKKFIDKRKWLSGTKEKGSIVAVEGIWRFGLTYEEKDFSPVNEIIQDIFIKELKASGIDALKYLKTNEYDYVLYDYVLEGNITSFEFRYKGGSFQSNKGRSRVKLDLVLYDVKGNGIYIDETFMRGDKKRSIFHSTNADRLLNVVLRRVIGEVYQSINKKLFIEKEDITLTINHVAIDNP